MEQSREPINEKIIYKSFGLVPGALELEIIYTDSFMSDFIKAEYWEEE